MIVELEKTNFLGSKIYYSKSINLLDIFLEDSNEMTYIEDTYTPIKSYTFWSCWGLKSVYFPNTEKIYRNAFFRCYALQAAYFPNCISIYQNTFFSCFALQSISFPKCIKISAAAFFNCTSLQEVDFPECTTIISQAFQTCTSLQKVSFPKCTTIGNSAFQYCSSLQSISLPKCSTIGSSAFRQCSSLQSFYLLASTVCTLNHRNAFFNTPIHQSSHIGTFGSIYVPASLVDSYKAATNWDYYSNRITAFTG